MALLEAALIETTLGPAPVEELGLTHASSVTPPLVLRLAALPTVMWFWVEAPRRTAVSLGSEVRAPGTPNVTAEPYVPAYPLPVLSAAVVPDVSSSRAYARGGSPRLVWA